MTAIERFKRRLADAIERICVLEEQLEEAQARIAELELQLPASVVDEIPRTKRSPAQTRGPR